MMLDVSIFRADWVSEVSGKTGLSQRVSAFDLNIYLLSAILNLSFSLPQTHVSSLCSQL